MTVSLIDLGNLLDTPIQEGDAGIVLKPDGTFRIFTTGEIDGENLTSAQHEQGRKLIALSLALKHEQIMDVLYAMSEDPRIVGEGITISPAQLAS